MSTTSITITAAGGWCSRPLIATSALHGCTTVDGNVVTKSWPRLSSGEEKLWAVLAHLNGVGRAPADEDLVAGLDTRNADIALTALRVHRDRQAAIS